MRRTRAIGLAVVPALALALLPFAAPPALAAPPANDKPAGAVALQLGDKVVQDTTQATTDAQDDALNRDCAAPETNASVWYSFTPKKDRKIVVDMSRSDYSGGILVFRGTPTANSLVTCGPGLVALRARAGTTYTFMVISDTPTRGGRLVLTLKSAQAPKVRVTVARRGLAYRGGAARIHGSYRCSHAEGGAVLTGSLSQRVGRLKIPAQFGKEILCNGRVHRWSARLVSRTGIYDRGPARAKVRILACGIFVCRGQGVHRHMRLVRAWGHGGSRMVMPRSSEVREPRPLVEHPPTWS